MDFRKGTRKRRAARTSARYSAALPARRGVLASAPAPWRSAAGHGDGVARWSLHRWSNASKRDTRFHRVRIVTPLPAAPAPGLVIELSTVGASVGRLDVDAPRSCWLSAVRWHGRRVLVYAYTRPTDTWKGFDGLCALVTQGLDRDPLRGDIFIFVSRDRIRAKTLQWDGRGLCLYMLSASRGAGSRRCGSTTMRIRSH